MTVTLESKYIFLVWQFLVVYKKYLNCTYNKKENKMKVYIEWGKMYKVVVDI